jgi:hypothetical protein
VPSQDQKPNNIMMVEVLIMVFHPTTMPFFGLALSQDQNYISGSLAYLKCSFFGLVPLQNPKARNIIIS